MSDLKKTIKEDSDETKKAFVFNGENVTVKYDYSFKAKLSLASDDVKNQYKEIISVLNKYGVKTSTSWKQERVYLGRNTYAVILFKGSKLCVAYALDPKEYVESKYKAIDASDVKRFQATPTILKITSLRKLGYASQLFEILFAENKIEKKTDDVKEISVETKTKEELINLELIKVTVSKKSGEEVSLDEEKKIISEAIALDENDVVEDSDEEEDGFFTSLNVKTGSFTFETGEHRTIEGRFDDSIMNNIHTVSFCSKYSVTINCSRKAYVGSKVKKRYVLLAYTKV